MRLAVLTNIPAPYRVELFAHAGARFSAMKVLFQGRMDADRSWEAEPDLPFDHSYLPESALTIGGRRLRWNSCLSEELEAFRPDSVVVFGFSPVSCLATMIAGRLGAQFISLNDGTKYTDPTVGLEAFYRRQLLRRASGAIAASSLGADYFVRLGVPEDRIRIVELTTDLLKIRSEMQAPGRRAEARERWSLSGPTICFVGRLIATKRILDACEAFRHVRGAVPDAQMLIAGEGPERGAIEEWISLHQEERIQLVGGLEQDDVVNLYAASDVLVFPATRERFGLVVVEALAAGRPVVSTRTCGAGADFVRDGDNGYLVAEGDIKGIAGSLVAILTDTPHWGDLSRAADDVVERHDVRVEAERFADAIDYFARNVDAFANRL
jgi:glycosyltransferase involved in cell wall biosynthesis